eukprot:COSAG05_NODE_2033_length_3667_cov_5.369395_2_plen_731_part_01
MPLVDVFVAHYKQVNWPGAQQKMAEWQQQKRGRRVHIYDNAIPVIDKPAQRVRLFPWQLWLTNRGTADVPAGYGLQGSLSWYCDNGEDGWTQPCGPTGTQWAGDAYLLYPQEPGISSPREAVSPSIRWELFRRGLEDAETFFLLQRLIADVNRSSMAQELRARSLLWEANAALQAVETVSWGFATHSAEACCDKDLWTDPYSTNTTLMHSVKRRVAMAIEALSAELARADTATKVKSDDEQLNHKATIGTPHHGRRTFYPFVATEHCNSTDLMSEYRAHAGLVSGIILYAYGPSMDGLLTPNSGAAHNHAFPPDICEGNYNRWGEIAPIYAAIGGHGVGEVLANISMENRFIADAIAKALHFGLSGYNFDIEGSAHGPKELLPFFTRFANALHEHNMTLTSDVDGCPQGCEGISCAEYEASPIDGIVLMSWYKAEPGQRFLDKVTNTTKRGSLGARKTMAGWSGSHWMSNCSVMDFVLSQGIQSIGWWSGSLRNDENWALLQEFLTIDPQNPPPPAKRHCKTAGYTPPSPAPAPAPAPDPELPPFKITHNGLCISASEQTLPANISLGSCGGEFVHWEFHDGGMCRGWVGSKAAELEGNAALCIAVLSSDTLEKTRAECNPGQTLVLARVRNGQHLFTLDNVTGTLRSNSCIGMCAASTSQGLRLASCSTDGASGFHSSKEVVSFKPDDLPPTTSNSGASSHSGTENRMQPQAAPLVVYVSPSGSDSNSGT